ncbi:MFS transporter [Paenarthrobacter sp. DKR-5]|uniref:MFS transporter n=1 Tax=Paenarthrobacter sp. DKR-5 TaxID=2835535 RepID=UPI001BDC47B2|nr:MFS transporter [Paenarthrobacter sp. DKR-5]MBT1001524.1 MFS transporter [Paenarthrobacter sp. DKR-5]
MSRRTREDPLPLPALVTLAAVGFTAITTELLPSGLLPQIGQGFGVSEAEVGHLTAGYALVIVVSVIPLTKFLGRVPRKALLFALILMFALSNVLIGVSPSFPLALTARLVGGVAHGLLWSTMAPFVARIVPARKMGRSMAIVFSGNNLGLAIGAPVGTALGTFLGWRASFILLAAAGGLLALLALWLLPAVPAGEASERPSVRKAIRQPGVKTVVTAWPLLLLARFSLFTYIAPFVIAAGLPAYTIGLSLSVLGIAGLLGIWLAGLSVDRRPRRSMLIATSVILVCYLLLPVAGRNLATALVLLCLWGAGLGAAGIYNQSAILLAGDKQRDAANSLMVLTTQLGIAVGATYGGFALNGVGALLIPLAAAVPSAVALAMVVAGRRAGYPAGPGEKRQSGKPAPAEPARDAG